MVAQQNEFIIDRKWIYHRLVNRINKLSHEILTLGEKGSRYTAAGMSMGAQQNEFIMHRKGCTVATDLKNIEW